MKHAPYSMPILEHDHEVAVSVAVQTQDGTKWLWLFVIRALWYIIWKLNRTQP